MPITCGLVGGGSSWRRWTKGAEEEEHDPKRAGHPRGFIERFDGLCMCADDYGVRGRNLAVPSIEGPGCCYFCPPAMAGAVSKIRPKPSYLLHKSRYLHSGRKVGWHTRCGWVGDCSRLFPRKETTVGTHRVHALGPGFCI
jgi:hypothetical protein